MSSIPSRLSALLFFAWLQVVLRTLARAPPVLRLLQIYFAFLLLSSALYSFQGARCTPLTRQLVYNTSSLSFCQPFLCKQIIFLCAHDICLRITGYLTFPAPVPPLFIETMHQTPLLLRCFSHRHRCPIQKTSPLLLGISILESAPCP